MELLYLLAYTYCQEGHNYMSINLKFKAPLKPEVNSANFCSYIWKDIFHAYRHKN